MAQAEAGRVSTLPPVQGHEAVRRRLARAAARGDVPASMLLHGPPGVGRQRVALWFAQLLACEAPTDNEPCNHCRSCKLARALQHPDIHWFFPLPRPKVYGSPDRLADAFEDARAAELDARRAQPLRPSLPDQSVGLYLAQVRTIRRLVATTPAMGHRKVFLIGDAEMLVPQESSEEAANAVLKVLEEPPADTTFLLTTTDPEMLLPTIRSRLAPVRLRPLPVDRVAAFLVEHAAASADAAHLAAHLAEGSIGRALAFLPQDGEPGPLDALRDEARQILQSVASKDAAARVAAAHAQSPTGARGHYSDLLAALNVWLRDLAAFANDARDSIVNVDAMGELEELATALPAVAVTAPDAIRLVDEARALARININPQLAMAHLLRQLRDTLRGFA
jgi:DNA polymerase-3 subunit delta'